MGNTQQQQSSSSSNINTISIQNDTILTLHQDNRTFYAIQDSVFHSSHSSSEHQASPHLFIPLLQLLPPNASAVAISTDFYSQSNNKNKNSASSCYNQVVVGFSDGSICLYDLNSVNVSSSSVV